MKYDVITKKEKYSAWETTRMRVYSIYELETVLNSIRNGNNYGAEIVFVRDEDEEVQK